MLNLWQAGRKNECPRLQECTDFHDNELAQIFTARSKKVSGYIRSEAFNQGAAGLSTSKWNSDFFPATQGWLMLLKTLWAVSPTPQKRFRRIVFTENLPQLLILPVSFPAPSHWCCSSRSSRTWPLLIWQSFCHNSLPTVVIIFEKSVSRPCCKKVIHTHEFLSTLYYPMEQLAIRHPEQHNTPQV